MNSNGDMSVFALTSRAYETEHDLEQMQRLLMDARSRTDDWRYWHVGELIWGFFMVMCHLNPYEFIRLWHNAEGKLVAYAILGEDPSFDCQVLPEYAWSGIELAALAWTESRWAETLARDVPQQGVNLVTAVRQDDAKRLAFLKEHGFRDRGEFAEINLLRSLDIPIPESDVPDGFQIRALAEVGEISKRAAIQRDVWSPWTVGNVSDDQYAQFTKLPGYHRDLDVAAFAPDGTIVAYVNGWIDPVNRIGDFGPVGALSAYRGQGLTRAALLESLRRMRAYGMDRVCISTGVLNTPALRLYQSIGFQQVNQCLDYTKIVFAP